MVEGSLISISYLGIFMGFSFYLLAGRAAQAGEGKRDSPVTGPKARQESGSRGANKIGGAGCHWRLEEPILFLTEGPEGRGKCPLRRRTKGNAHFPSGTPSRHQRGGTEKPVRTN